MAVNGKSQGGIGELVTAKAVEGTFIGIGALIRGAMTWIVTIVWIVAVLYGGAQNAILGYGVFIAAIALMAWRGLGDRFGFPMPESLHVMVPFVGDMLRLKSRESALNAGKMLWQLSLDAGIIKDEDPNGLPGTVEYDNNGNIVYHIQGTLSGSLGSVRSILTSKKVVETHGFDFVRVTDYTDGTFALTYLSEAQAQGDAPTIQANRELVDMGILPKDSVILYPIELYDARQGLVNPLFIFTEMRMGSVSVLVAQDKILKEATRFSASYGKVVSFQEAQVLAHGVINWQQLEVEHETPMEDMENWKFITFFVSVDPIQQDLMELALQSGISKDMDPDALRGTTKTSKRGLKAFLIEGAKTGNMSDLKHTLTSAKTLGARGEDFVYLDEFPDGKFSIQPFNVNRYAGDRRRVHANRELRDIGILPTDSGILFPVEFYTTPEVSDPIFIFPSKRLGSVAVVDIQDKLMGAYARYGAVYSELVTFDEVAKERSINWDDLAASYRVDKRAMRHWTFVKMVVNVEETKRAANEFLRQVGLTRDGQYIDAKLYTVFKKDNPNVPIEDRLVFFEKIQGRSLASLMSTVEPFKSTRGAFTVKAGKLKSDGNLFTTREREDPKTSGKYLMAPDVLRFISHSFLDDSVVETYDDDKRPSLDAEKMSAICATNESGEEISITLKGTSGMLVAGMPGSGKTAGVTSFAQAYASSLDVEMTIIDCKGGDDWTAYAPIADYFAAGADTIEELEKIDTIIGDAVEDMNNRVKTNKSILGESNFWNANVHKRRNAERPFKLMIIDECQDIFRSPARGNKEEAVLLERILSNCTRLIKKGRSAGVCVIFITQKPTADSIPTGIRDNCGMRMSFRLVSASSVGIVFGGDIMSDPTFPSPLSIPKSRLGGAVIALENSTYEEVRFFYTPEDDSARLLRSSEKYAERLKEGLIDKNGERVEPIVYNNNESFDSDGGESFMSSEPTKLRPRSREVSDDFHLPERPRSSETTRKGLFSGESYGKGIAERRANDNKDETPDERKERLRKKFAPNNDGMPKAASLEGIASTPRRSVFSTSKETAGDGSYSDLEIQFFLIARLDDERRREIVNQMSLDDKRAFVRFITTTGKNLSSEEVEVIVAGHSLRGSWGVDVSNEENLVVTNTDEVVSENNESVVSDPEVTVVDDSDSAPITETTQGVEETTEESKVLRVATRAPRRRRKTS